MNIPADYIPIIISASVFLCVLLIIVGIAIYVRFSAKKQAIIDKIRKTSRETTTIDRDTLPSQTEGGIKNRIFSLLGVMGKPVVTSEAIDYSQLRPLFLKAGIRRENAPAIFWGAKLLLMLLLPIGFILMRLFYPGSPLTVIQQIALFTLLAIIGFYLPNLWIQFKIARRKETIIKGFPDALDLMVVCVEAGMGLDSAITRVAKEIELANKILSNELHIYTLEMRAGKSRREALKNLAMRTDLPEVNNLVTLLIQTDKFGTSIGQALKVYSDTMRVQRYQRAEEKAAKIPVKLIFPLILFIFPALFVAILGPAAINIYKVFIKGSVI